MVVAKPMQAFLSSSLGVCLHSGTSVRESGLIVSAEKQQDEIILFFHMDCSEGRGCLNIPLEGARICDYLIFYTKNNDQREIICFLELKGGKERDATEQVLSTYTGFKRLVERRQRSKIIENVILKVCICFHGAAPRADEHARSELKKVFGKNVLIKHGINKQFKLLGDFLRQQ